jgi:MFS family permease
VTAERLGPSFAKLWTASAFSNLADGVLKIALPLVAVHFTDSPLLLGGLGLAMSLPWLLFALPFGAIADRTDRRIAMLIANGTRLTVAALTAFALFQGAGSIWLLYVAGFVFGVAEVLYDTTAQSILPQLVDRRQLTRANARLHGVETLANQFAGPPLGGFLVAAALALAVGAPAALWALALAALAWVPGRYTPVRAEEPSTLRADIVEGLRYLTGHRVLRTLAIMTGASNFASSAVMTVFVLYAVGPDAPMGLSEFSYGVLNTTIAVGALLGSLIAAGLSRRIGRSRSLALGVVTFTAMCAIPALTADPWIIGAVFVISGAGVMIWNVIAVSLRQQITPDRLLGRLNSCYRLLAWGTIPLGALAGGAIGEAFGLRAVFWSAAAIAASTGWGLLVVRSRAIAEAEEAVADAS